MIIRSGAVCNTCDSKILLRLSIGLNPEQKHIINCPGCDERLEVILVINNFEVSAKLDFVNASEPSESIDFNNCDYQFHCHPDFQAPQLLEKGDIFSPNIKSIMKMRDEFEHFDSMSKSNNRFVQHRRIYSNPNDEKLVILAKIFILLGKNKNAIAERLIQKNKHILQVTATKSPISYAEDFLNHYIGYFGVDFYNRLVLGWNNISIDEQRRLKSIRPNKKIGLYSSSKFIFEKYFSRLPTFWYVFRHLNNNIAKPENKKDVAGDFAELKSYYAECFEEVANYLFIAAGINNFSARGSVDKFQKITSIEEYQALDNGGKDRCFKDTEFDLLCDIYINKIRNASYHADTYIDPETAIITFSDKNKNIEMAYIDYLILCTKITETLAAFMLFQIKYLQPEN